jgi:hypothetical protein
MAKDIRLAEMLIQRRAVPDPSSLADQPEGVAPPGVSAGGHPVYSRSSWASSPREVTPVLVKQFRRWNATVRGETQHCAATSLLDMPWLTSWATFSSMGVNFTRVDGSRLRAISPAARSSWVARAASGSARRSSNVAADPWPAERARQRSRDGAHFAYSSDSIPPVNVMRLRTLMARG